ncbi:MAG: Bifunctional riboflavin kinase/FMN adenylyltransferase [Desulfovibrio sp.]
MIVARSLEEAVTLATDVPHAVTIGNFDGVHIGHRELIRITGEKAAVFGTRSVLVTFDPHPVHVVRGVGSPGIITPLSRKLELLEEAGLDAVLVLPFTKAVAAMSAGEFVESVLVRALNVKELVIGFNFALGKNRSGNLTTLTALGEEHEFMVTQVQPVIVGRETVSSTLIREHISSGDMEKATLLLGRMHTVDGTVVPGEARGRTLGYPTANIEFPEMLLPPLGAYATWVQVFSDGAAEPRMSMTSVGTNPTFGGEKVTLESHLLDFSGDLYGKKVRLHFARRLRGEIRFKSVGDLVARLGHDAQAARDALCREEKPC